jgi:uncharacterized glyoxalase superfamily protein PhnB
MQIAHVHVYVADRPAAVEWLGKVWGAHPEVEDHEMSLFAFGDTQLVVNDVEEDVLSTVAFTSTDCDGDFARVVAAGAVPIHEPEDKPWGVRAAFVQGPGKLVFEFEQGLGGWNPSA